MEKNTIWNKSNGVQTLMKGKKTAKEYKKWRAKPYQKETSADEYKQVKRKLYQMEEIWYGMQTRELKSLSNGENIIRNKSSAKLYQWNKNY